MAMDDMIAAYQRLMGGAAQKTTPDNPFLPTQGGSTPQPHNEFSRLLPNHPRIAGALENAALMASMIPERSTTGGNIAGVAQAFLGLPLARMQREEAFKGPEEAEQMRQAEMFSKISGGLESMARGQYYSDLPASELERARLAVKPPPMWDTTEHIDDQGNPWKFNQVAGRMQHVGTQNLPEDYQPSFENEKRRARTQTSTEFERLLSGELLTNINEQRTVLKQPPISQDDLVKQYAATRSIFAGASAGGAAAATDPYKSAADFVNQQEAKVYEGLDKEPKDFFDWKLDQGLKGKYFNTPEEGVAAYNTEIANLRNQRAQRDVQFGAYRNSGAPKKGISFESYRSQQAPSGPTRGAYLKENKWYDSETHKEIK